MINIIARCVSWAIACFGIEIVRNKQERSCRFLEEALELVQSLGLSKEKAQALLTYVYSRPRGEPTQEVAGVVVTLSTLCYASDIDLVESTEEELKRIWNIIDKVRNKNLNKEIKG